MKAPSRLLAPVLFLCFAQLAIPQGNQDGIRGLLAKLDRGHTDTRVLARMFRLGDSRIDELIFALEDPDENVSLNAQVVIRYLGNKRGMTALTRRLRAGQLRRTTGAVPVPLTDWDFEWIEREYLCADCKLRGWGVSEYGYALVLDDSVRAQETLSRLLEKFRPDWLPRKQPGMENFRLNGTAVERELVARAFWLTSSEKEVAMAKVLSTTANNDKTLFQVYVNMGSLAEEWFHVVTIREGNASRIISVTLVAQS